MDEHKVVAKKSQRAKFADVCENCDQPYEAGTWVVKVSIGNYEHFIHEDCPQVAVSS